jgi:hypothetical protein
MFLALCPFSEIVCLTSVMMAWLYIGLGFIGNHHVAETTKEKNILRCTVEHSEVLSVSKAENCFWFEDEITPDINFGEITRNYKCFIPITHRENFEYQLSIKLIHLNEHKPNRAPPAFS